MILDNMFHNVSRCTNLRDDLKSKKLQKRLLRLRFWLAQVRFLHLAASRVPFQ